MGDGRPCFFALLVLIDGARGVQEIDGAAEGAEDGVVRVGAAFSCAVVDEDVLHRELGLACVEGVVDVYGGRDLPVGLGGRWGRRDRY